MLVRLVRLVGLVRLVRLVGLVRLAGLVPIAEIILVDNDTILHDYHTRVGANDGLERDGVACANIVAQCGVLQAEVNNIIGT